MARRRLVTVAAAAGLVAAAAGCGSSSRTTTPPTGVPVGAASPSAGPSTSTGPTPASGPGLIGTESSRYGTILEANGKTLYLLTADTPTTSRCTDHSCTTVWPPLTGNVTAGAGIDAAKLGHLTLPDGTRQSAYGGHPLYFYIGDGGPGQVNGQGIVSFGGTWYVVSASTGEAVTKATSGSTGSSTSPTSASSGYGASY